MLDSSYCASELAFTLSVWVGVFLFVCVAGHWGILPVPEKVEGNVECPAVLLSYCPPYSLETGSLHKLDAHSFARLAGQQAPGSTCHSPSTLGL